MGTPVSSSESNTLASKLKTLNLYTRKDPYIPRIAAVHDLCGYGKCSLGIAIPVLSAAGCDVCPVPTGLFSSHTAFPTWYMHDTTEILDPYLLAWQEVNIDIDVIYSGFLGAPEQVDSIQKLYKTYPNALRIVDPVMADHGEVYPTYTPELCAAMSELARGADLLTPNLTEAAIILGETWKGSNIDDEEARRILAALIDCGAKTVVLKGIERGDGIIRNFVASKAVINESDFSSSFEMLEVSNVYLPYTLHGTGDLYCSCLIASIMAGCSLYESVVFAGNFVVEAMEITNKQPDYENRGVSFEPLLGKIASLICS